MTRRTFLAGLALGPAGRLAGADGPGDPGTAIAPSKRLALFNGRNLDGFYTWLRENRYDDPARVFRVDQGMIRITGEEWGGLTTRSAYRDYRLVLEWRWGGPTHGDRKDKARDSGILLHGRGADGGYNGIWLESIECQIIEGGCGDFILVGGSEKPALTVECRLGPDGQHYWQRGGEPVRKDRGRFNWYGRDVEWKDAIGFRGRQDLEKPVGEWNRSEAICDGATITNLVNGTVVNVGRDASHTEGRIQIQSEGAEIWIRRFELLPLRQA